MSASRSTDCRWIPVVVAAVLLAASPLAAGESRWYLTGKLGQARMEQNFGPPGFGWRVDDRGSVTSVEVGFGLHRHLGLQAGYHDLGGFVGAPRPCRTGDICPLPASLPQFAAVFPGRAEFTAVSLSAVPRWPLTERVSVYGKLGVLDWQGRLSAPLDGGGAYQIQRSSDRDLLAGIGARYAFPKGLGLLLEYESSDLLDTVSLGASWRF